MNLFIPPLGTEIELAQPWTFALYHEGRNDSLFSFLGIEYRPSWRDPEATTVTLDSGTRLKVDRIFIRKGAKDFDSVTFYMKGCRIPGHTESYTCQGQRREYKVPAKGVRFWAKLADVNKIIIKDPA